MVTSLPTPKKGLCRQPHVPHSHVPSRERVSSKSQRPTTGSCGMLGWMFVVSLKNELPKPELEKKPEILEVSTVMLAHLPWGKPKWDLMDWIHKVGWVGVEKDKAWRLLSGVCGDAPKVTCGFWYVLRLTRRFKQDRYIHKKLPIMTLDSNISHPLTCWWKTRCWMLLREFPTHSPPSTIGVTGLLTVFDQQIPRWGALIYSGNWTSNYRYTLQLNQVVLFDQNKIWKQVFLGYKYA